MGEQRHVSALVIGGGPSGLAAATSIVNASPDEVLVIEREARAGGVPRHCDHTGFGMRDLHRVLRGPAYAEAWRSRAVAAGVELMESAMVTGWTGERSVEVTSPAGRVEISADVVVLATGARERPRPARLVPGDRTRGVMTTGQLQQQVHLQGRTVGENAVVVGGELVSWSAVMTLREAGCRTVAMVTPYRKAEAYSLFRVAGRTMLRVPVHTRSRVVDIRGRGRVGEVVIENVDTGAREVLSCDTVVMSGDWVPDHELARTGGLDIDPATKGPVVDAALATSRPGVFAVGNMLHPVDTADIAALDGTHVGAAVGAWLATESSSTDELVEQWGGAMVKVAPPLRWVVPQRFHPAAGAPPRNRLLTWCDEFITAPVVEILQDGEILCRHHIWWPAAPGRVFRLPVSILDGVSAHGGPVTIRLAGH